MKVNNTLAKALYDNKAECPDELAFRRGDILTVLEQNLQESEGWWKCSLHGKQGLAPANRLQLLTPSQASSTQQVSIRPPVSPLTIYQVPSAHKPPELPSVYEKMDSWTEPSCSSSASSLPTQDVYKVPALAAKLLSEKTQSSLNQHLLTLPRASWASVWNNKRDIYDVPSPQRHVFTQGPATPPPSRKLSTTTQCCLKELHQLYDIPLNLEKARTSMQQESSVDNVYVTPTTMAKEHDSSIETAPQGKHWGQYNTLPNPRKSEWIYDVPVSAENTELKKPSQNHSPNKPALIYDIPPARFGSGVQNIPTLNNEGKSENSQSCAVLPRQRKLTLPEMPLYDVPSTHEVLFLRQNGNHDVPGLLSSRIEKESHQQTLYDVPKGKPNVSSEKKGVEKHNYDSGESIYNFPSQVSRDTKSDQDRLSVSSVDSRTSAMSTSSNTSTESFSSTASSSTTPSSSEESTKKNTMELESAIETLTKLQHSVSSSIASLMIFVSSRWRYQEHLEENIEEIQRAVDHIKTSLGEFLDFAQAIESNAAWASDRKLQSRIKKQLNILMDSFLILVETREALNNCQWSLEVLVIKKPQNNPDDLDRFVMVARTIPDDIKRFVSIIIANGKLLFRNSCKEKGKVMSIGVEHKMANYSLEQRREENFLKKGVLDKPKEDSQYLEMSTVDMAVQLQKSVEVEQTQPSLSASKLERKDTEFKIKGSAPTTKHNILSMQSPAKKMTLSDLCRLYFGAVQKAIGAFLDSLSHNKSPEVFIAQSKLIIMVGQKLVDALCQEVLEKATRNDILCGSCKFCGLMKDLAIATKNAAMQYPNPEAMGELQDQADRLSKYIQQFQAMIE